MSNQEDFLKMLGDELSSASKGRATIKTTDALSGKKTIMLYFSAHWCPPCRRFTPKLIDFYNTMKNKGGQWNDFELIFVSFDKDEDSYNEYTSNMPWLCLPFDADKSTKTTLSKKYKAEGIPHLVVLDENGDVITMDGVEEVSKDEEGTRFPWKPKSFSELWPEKVLTKDGLVDSSTLDDKYLMLYFSAHWCPPCRGFTPTLSKAYTKLKEERDDFELVFLSSDSDIDSFNEYYNEMTFCALPYEEREAKNGLSKRFEIRGIPSLLILGPVPPGGGDRPLINKNLRYIIENGDFSDFPFHPKPYGDLELSGSEISSKKCLVVFHENGDDDEQKEVINIVKAVAERHKEKSDMKFLWALEAKGLAHSIRSASQMSEMDDGASMILLDVPDEGGYYKSKEKDITVESALEFIKNPGERFQLE